MKRRCRRLSKLLKKHSEGLGWNRGHGRARYLYATLPRQIEKHNRDFAFLEIHGQWKTIRGTFNVDVPLVASFFYHHVTGWAQLMDTEMKDYRNRCHGADYSLEFPYADTGLKAAKPALAMGDHGGNKPARFTSLMALLLLTFCKQSEGSPDRVVNAHHGTWEYRCSIGQSSPMYPRWLLQALLK
ncbi:MAG: hypothetical protein IPL08_18060 [Saprospiraceae bacterium]|nr:hypothetical protein [Saprospiraceae bacterium]